jgi:spore germination cell wall hydrolase CwlJ-like protein
VRGSVTRSRRIPVERRSRLGPALLGLGIWLSFPTVTAYQDITSLISGQESEARWAAVIERSVAGSVHQAEMPFNDPNARLGAISGAGVKAVGIGEVAFRTKGKAIQSIPDEERVNRSEKQGRVVKVVPMAPPRLFNAGSIIEQKGAFLAPVQQGEVPMAFLKPDIQGQEIQIAGVFHLKHDPKAVPSMLPVVAKLVNNEEADVLATAYAPSEPDYAKASPFASILREEEDTGRFIPPIDPGDHSWAKSPLPAKVFSAKEQKCLAEAVYFEARGEPVEGQAAVAQVVLNRVRNPAYPSTICGVVYQNDHWRNRCQFSFACDGIKDRITSPGHYRVAKDVAMAVTAGKIWLESVGSSTHYHATYVRPRWAGTMKKLTKIGQHIFYRTYGGGWN